MHAGVHPEAVVKLIQDRLRNRSSHPSRRLGLVVEGGAMRGVYGAGSLLGLHFLGGHAIFDGAYAISAGAINVAHFLSGVGERKAGTYYRALTDGRFINFRRIWKLVDIDFLVDVVLRKEFPLEWDSPTAARTPFKVGLLDCDLARGQMVEATGGPERVLQLLKAAVALPVLYNRPVVIDGHRYMDGGLAIPYPIEAAIQDRMTDVVVLLSQNPALPVRPRGLLQLVLWSSVFARGRAPLIRIFGNWRPELMRLNSLVTKPSRALAGVNTLVIAPTDQKIDSATVNPRLLKEAIYQMAIETISLLRGSGSKADFDRYFSRWLL